MMISIIVPVYNEEGNLKEFYNRLVKVFHKIEVEYELIFIDDGSSDESLFLIKNFASSDENTKYIAFSRNFGQQIAFSAGIDAMEGDCAVLIDSDLQDPPETIADLYKKYSEGFSIVYAKRRKRSGETVFKKITARIFYKFLKSIISFPIPLDTGDFRLLDKKVIEHLRKMPERSKFLRGQVAWLGFKSAEVLYDRDSRFSGETGYTVGKMIRLALNAITSFSNKPLYFVSIIGLLMSVFSFLLILLALFSFFVFQQTVTGWTSLMISVSFLGGIQLLSIGIIGEYIARINSDVKQRPLYVVDETNIDSSN